MSGARVIGLDLAEIRANLESIRPSASEALRGRELVRRADDALGLLEQAVHHRGGAQPAAGIVRAWRELRHPTRSLDQPRVRWKLASVCISFMLVAIPVAVYIWRVDDLGGLHRVEDFFQSAEGFLTVMALVAAWSYSAWRFERQQRVESVLDAIDRCRALILIIDAHALAKDFSRHWDARRANAAESVDGLHRGEVIEYLAIGVRISKLTAQIAASYGSVIHDHAVIAAIDSVSQLALSIERNALAKQDMLSRATATRGADSGA